MNLGEQMPEAYAVTASRPGWPDQTEYWKDLAKAENAAITWREQGFEANVTPIIKLFKD